MQAIRRTLISLLLLAVCPPFVMLLWYTHVALGGSLTALVQRIAADGLGGTIAAAWGPVVFGSPTAWTILGVFVSLQLALVRLLPAKWVAGPPTPSGHIPRYKDNGLAAFALTMALFLGASYGLGLFSASIIYDHFGELLGALNIFSLAFCGALYLKGRFRPSPGDHGLSGNPIFDYYWGTELYPRIAGWDVKQCTNCRFGMMAWPLIIVSFAAKQAELYGLSSSMLVAVVLQLVYIAKFFHWESGYLRSLDIMHDRAGFYICWGCLVWVPGLYTSSTLYLVQHPHALGAPLTLLLLALGVAAIGINYWADWQRQQVRATAGATKVWGRAPELIRARYTDEHGEQRENLLLASGFWGITRHFHYVPEWLGALLWTVPAGFTHILPYFYVIFLFILLTDRSLRDDQRCAAKYGDDWQLYRSKVRYRIVPGVF